MHPTSKIENYYKVFIGRERTMDFFKGTPTTVNSSNIMNACLSIELFFERFSSNINHSYTENNIENIV